MKWLAQLCPYVMELEDKLERASADLALASDYMHDATESAWHTRQKLAEMRASLTATADAADQFRRMWQETAERAVAAERTANFYRTAYGNVCRAVADAESDGPPA